jgi:hypothetical protein
MMNEFDLVIHGGLLVSDSGSQKADLGIKDGKIAVVGLNLSGKEVLDASGLLVIPGGVDPHVHLNMPTATTRTSVRIGFPVRWQQPMVAPPLSWILWNHSPINHYRKHCGIARLKRMVGLGWITDCT